MRDIANKYAFVIILIIVSLFSFGLQAKDNKFVLVIDAGHGGKDPGAIGTRIKEKNINLGIALKLGALIQANHPDVKVVYTRKKDVFVELQERAAIANRVKADLFISIHTNSAGSKSAYGTETYTLGLARTEENLRVAKRENSVILLEDDFSTRYEGFDPRSTESYIMFEFLQDKHMEQSINFASLIQTQFKRSAGRIDRGVRQAGFLVLRKTSMPSVLVELGYISNRQEEQFMRTAAGQNKLAEALYDAFCKYKKNYDRRKGNISGAVVAPVANEKTPPPGSEADILNKKQQATRQKTSVSSTTSVNRNTKGKVIYKIQFLTSNKKLPANSRLFKGYKNVDFYVEKGIYKYTYGETSDFNSIRKMRRTIAKDFKDAFIIAFKDGKKVKY